MELINIGFGNLVSAQRLISIVGPDSASVLIMDSDHVILSALSTEKLAPRLGLRVEDFGKEDV